MRAPCTSLPRPDRPEFHPIRGEAGRGEARRVEARRFSSSTERRRARKRKERVKKIGWPRRLKASIASPSPREISRISRLYAATLAGKYILLPRNNINYRGDAARRLARKNMIYRNDRPRAGAIYARRRAPMKFSPFPPPSSPPIEGAVFLRFIEQRVTNRSNFPFACFPLTVFLPSVKINRGARL